MLLPCATPIISPPFTLMNCEDNKWLYTFLKAHFTALSNPHATQICFLRWLHPQSRWCFTLRTHWPLWTQRKTSNGILPGMAHNNKECGPMCRGGSNGGLNIKLTSILALHLILKLRKCNVATLEGYWWGTCKTSPMGRSEPVVKDFVCR